MGILIDEDIAHIECVMRPSLCTFEDGPILPAEYWRRRLYRLLDSCHLTKVQLCAIDSLLLQLDRFDLEQHDQPGRSRRSAPGSKPKAVLSGHLICRCRSGRSEHPLALALPLEPVAQADIGAPDTDVVMGAGTKTQKPRVAVAATGRRPRRPHPGTRTGLFDAMTAGNSANRQRRAELAPPADEENRWSASFSLATAVQELTVDGIAAMLNAVSASHVLLGVRAMRLMQISGFEVWRNGMTHQPQTSRFDVSTA